ncbi:GNAT family acetyltransferase [Salinisphaera dokdonensis CL-ES53]|uniref:GNAT family acetyltransferase n=1 Tax=Salinisphaera dokdonensis CL-ES53 TaxID=1304272 RepID=A0ABV2B4S6_9GAMM
MSHGFEEVVLSGDRVVLEPLNAGHADALANAAADGELWKLWYTFVPAPDAVAAYIDTALAEREQGGLAFAVRDRASDTVIGSTRFCHVDTNNRRAEVGYTWYAARFQRTAINSECKRLMLAHAFDSFGAIAIEFRTHWHNRASRAAIARLGAKQDGVLRNHMKSADGIYRDTVVFSITDQEWPAVRQNLDFQLGRTA